MRNACIGKLRTSKELKCALQYNEYVDLDERSENGIPVDGLPQATATGDTAARISSSGGSARSAPAPPSAGAVADLAGPSVLELVTNRERSPTPSEPLSPDTLNPPSPADSTLSLASSGREFDPRTRAFSDEELKPQPMIKKSRTQGPRPP